MGGEVEHLAGAVLALQQAEDGPGEVFDLSAHRSKLRTSPKPKT